LEHALLQRDHLVYNNDTAFKIQRVLTCVLIWRV